jgi:hypothetical protein
VDDSYSDGSLLAIFPLVHLFRGCVALALSLDGRRWSRPRALVGCRTHGPRTAHHPAAGIWRDGGRVYIYIQEDVPGIFADDLTPKHAVREGMRAQPRSKLFRYSFSAVALAEWTHARRRELLL